jgi:hypothetical protein
MLFMVKFILSQMTRILLQIKPTLPPMGPSREGTKEFPPKAIYSQMAIFLR